MQDNSQGREELGLCGCDIEPHWRDFMVGIMAHTVDLCVWLAEQAGGRARTRSPRTLRRRLLNAAVAWRWVFSDEGCELPLDEVCLHLGLRKPLVRERILAACTPSPDINQVVARILIECRNEDAHPKRKAAHPCRMGSPDWVRLRDYRSQNPLGSSFEDFCRSAVGVG